MTYNETLGEMSVTGEPSLKFIMHCKELSYRSSQRVTPLVLLLDNGISGFGLLVGGGAEFVIL